MRKERKECHISANEIMLAWPRQGQFCFRRCNQFFQIFISRKMNLDVIVWSGQLGWKRKTLSAGRQSCEDCPAGLDRKAHLQEIVLFLCLSVCLS